MEKTQLKSKQIAEILNKNGIYIDEPIATKNGAYKATFEYAFSTENDEPEAMGLITDILKEHGYTVKILKTKKIINKYPEAIYCKVCFAIYE